MEIITASVSFYHLQIFIENQLSCLAPSTGVGRNVYVAFTVVQRGRGLIPRPPFLEANPLVTELPRRFHYLQLSIKSSTTSLASPLDQKQRKTIKPAMSVLKDFQSSCLSCSVFPSQQQFSPSRKLSRSLNPHRHPVLS